MTKLISDDASMGPWGNMRARWANSDKKLTVATTVLFYFGSAVLLLWGLITAQEHIEDTFDDTKSACTALSAMDDGKYETDFQSALIPICGYKCTLEDCKEVADTQNTYHQIFWWITFIVQSVYFFHVGLHVMVFKNSMPRSDGDIFLNNAILRGIVELLAILLPLPLISMSNSLYTNEPKEDVMTHPSGMIFGGWVLLICFSSLLAFEDDNHKGTIFNKNIGASGDDANGKKKASNVRSIHW